MIRSILDFARGFVLGLVLGGVAGAMMTPARFQHLAANLEARFEAARAAYEEGRRQAEQELQAYFNQAEEAQ